jgi:hypothetical protein
MQYECIEQENPSSGWHAGDKLAYVDGRRDDTYTFVHFLWQSGPWPNATPHETNPLKGD